eukprot:3153591-Amphidinium_carterae.1
MSAMLAADLGLFFVQNKGKGKSKGKNKGKCKGQVKGKSKDNEQPEMPPPPLMRGPAMNPFRSQRTNRPVPPAYPPPAHVMGASAGPQNPIGVSA